MGKRARGQMSESLLLGALLTVVGGFLDAYTYLLRGGVFANAQTGNIVLLGLRLAQGRPLEAAGYLVPILAFAAGVAAAELTRQTFREHPRIHWRQIVVAAECLLLLGVCFVPRGDWDTAVNVAVSFTCALQVESFRKIGGSACATTMCTGNLRSGTELLFLWRASGDRGALAGALRYYGIIGCFIAGAALGALLAGALAERAALFCCGLLAAAFAVMFVREERPGPEGR